MNPFLVALRSLRVRIFLPLTALVAAASSFAEPARVFDVKAFGAVGDGVTMDTAALQRALDEAAAQGGGAVRVPAGTYLTGTIHLRSRVLLQLEKGATLLGSAKIDDYPSVGHGRDSGVKSWRVLVSGFEVQNAGVVGEGLIDGQGARLTTARPRPFLVRFDGCEDMVLRGVTLARSAMWTCHLLDSTRVLVEGVTIVEGKGVGNNDGIDIDASRDVTIRDCVIRSGDDAICLKATRDKPCRNVLVTGCTLASRWCALKLGTETVGDFENITLRDCVFERSHGINLLSVDGSRVRGVTVENITLKSSDLPIFIRLGARLKTYRRGEKPRPVGSIEQVLIRDVRGETHGAAAVFITGIPGHKVRDVRIEDVEVRVPGGDDGARLGEPLLEKESAYPQPYTIYGPQPAYGVTLRHVDGVTLRNLSVTCRKPDRRHAVACIDASAVAFEKPVFNNPAGAAAPEEVWLMDMPREELRFTNWEPRVKESAAPVPAPKATPVSAPASETDAPPAL